MTTYTQAHLAALREIRASGALRLTYEGKTTEFRSLDDLDRIISTVTAELAAAQPGSVAPPTRSVQMISGGRD